MAFGHGIDAVFKLNGTDISDYVTGIDPTFSRALAEIKVIGSHFVQQLYGHMMMQIAGEAIFDPALDAILWNAITGSAAITWEHSPQGTGVGKPCYSGSCMISEYKPGAVSDDAVKQGFQLVSDGTISRTAS